MRPVCATVPVAMHSLLPLLRSVHHFGFSWSFRAPSSGTLRAVSYFFFLSFRPRCVCVCLCCSVRVFISLYSPFAFSMLTCGSSLAILFCVPTVASLGLNPDYWCGEGQALLLCLLFSRFGSFSLSSFPLSLSLDYWHNGHDR